MAIESTPKIVSLTVTGTIYALQGAPARLSADGRITGPAQEVAKLLTQLGDQNVEVLPIPAVAPPVTAVEVCSRCGQPLRGPRPLLKPWTRRYCEECGEPLPLLTPEAKARLRAEAVTSSREPCQAHVMPPEFTPREMPISRDHHP